MHLFCNHVDTNRESTAQAKYIATSAILSKIRIFKKSVSVANVAVFTVKNIVKSFNLFIMVLLWAIGGFEFLLILFLLFVFWIVPILTAYYLGKKKGENNILKGGK